MTWFLASVSCSSPVIIWDKHLQSSFPSNTVLLISDNGAISAVVRYNSTLLPTSQHWTDLLHISWWWETTPTRSHTLQDSSWLYQTCWLLLIPFWHKANNVFLRTSHIFSLSLFSPIPHQQLIDTQPPQQGESGSKWIRLAGATSHTSLTAT